MDNDSIGVDISKDHLDVHALSRGAAARFSNTPAGFRALTRWLGKPALARVVYEPTGFYHRAFEAYFEARLPLVRVNPLQARRFAQACGVRAKTDVIDAAVLARMGAALALEPDTPIGKNQRDLKGLHTARVTLVKEQTQLSNRLNACDLVLPRSQIKARITLVQRQIKEIDAEIARRLAEVPAKSRAKAILCRVPGLGVVSSAAVLAVMPELGPSSVRSATRPPRVWRASPPTPEVRANGAAPPISRAGAAPCVRRFTCPPSPPAASTPTSPPSTRPSAPQENPQNSPSPSSCENSSSSQTPWCEMTGSGPQKPLDQHGYFPRKVPRGKPARA